MCRAASTFLILAVLAGCSSGPDEPEKASAPHMSAEIEQDAREIEARAEAAVRAADSVAQRELSEIQSEMRSDSDDAASEQSATAVPADK